MGKRRKETPSLAQLAVALRAPQRLSTRKPLALPVFAFLACSMFVMVAAVDPSAAVAMKEVGEPMYSIGPGQTLTATEAESNTTRGNFKVTEVVEAAPAVAGAPAAGTPDPGSAKAIALAALKKRGWGTSEYNCLVALWEKESHWNVYAFNAGSGAYGIPQAVPGNKMATAGADWKTNPATQISWGLSYIQGRYVTPCGAWSHSQAKGWY